jgi:small subunit ribosomal protein S6
VDIIENRLYNTNRSAHVTKRKTMKSYEIMTIYKADLGEEKAKALSKTLQELIVSLKGEVTEANFWGKRKFAYEIVHKTEGFYDVLNFDLDPANIDQFKTKLNLTEGLTRYLITAKAVQKPKAEKKD